jgi:hypothetical protein
MGNIDAIFVSMDDRTKEILKDNIEKYKKDGDEDAKEVVLKILKDADDETVRQFISSI